MVSLLTTGCPSGTFGFPTPRRLGNFLSESPANEDEQKLHDVKVDEKVDFEPRCSSHSLISSVDSSGEFSESL